MRVAQPDEERKPILHGLRFIAEFLNAIGPDTTQSQWSTYLKEYLKKNGPSGPLIAFGGTGQLRPAITLKRAQEVRQFISSDLRYLHFDRERIRTTETPFGPLTVRLNEQFKAGSWHCGALGTGKAEPGQAILTLKRQDHRVERWAATFMPFRITRTLKESLYAILGRALLTGDLVHLKVCRQCGKYLVAMKDSKRGFCEGTACKTDFFNQQKSGGNYWKDLRKRHREQAIAIAKGLKAKGASFEEIKTKTKLPRREVRKVLGRE